MFTSTNYEAITAIFNVKSFADGQTAFNTLGGMAQDRSMSEEDKREFNKNFYSFLTAIDTHFNTKVNLKSFVSEYIPVLERFTKKQRNEIALSEGNYIFSLLDGKGGYPSAWNAETGQMRFPSQWFIAYNTIASNLELLKSMRKSDSILIKNEVKNV